jgi:hypothetical protein
MNWKPGSNILLLTSVIAALGVGRAMAGSGGENMLLVVNPSDPASLQIANAYAAFRDIPAKNIVYITPPSDYQNNGASISQAEVMADYLTPIAAAISARGLTNQINYIGTIGQPVSYTINADPGLSATVANSMSYALSLLTPLTNGSGLTLQDAISHLMGLPCTCRRRGSTRIRQTYRSATIRRLRTPPRIPPPFFRRLAATLTSTHSITWPVRSATRGPTATRPRR